jgi:hypothetical protein
MPSWFYLFLFIPALFGSPVTRRDGPTVIPNPARVIFGSEMVFSATVQSVEPVREAELILEDSSSRSFVYGAEISVQDGSTLTARRDLHSEPVFPFSSIAYWWEVILNSGEKIVSEKQSLQYLDDRFAWQVLEKGRATVHWVEGETGSAEDAADLLLLDLGTISADLETPIPDNASLYIYPRLADFHSALGKLAYGWEGAISDPASGTILLAAAAGAEGRQALAALLPHETVHILLGAKWKTAYASLPLWLVEGMAAGYEVNLHPETDQALQQAAKDGSLIPVATLCRTFPSDERPALLAYAESKSFVAYLRGVYGLAAVRKAMGDYAAGADCGQGFIGSTGKNLDTLEKSWRSGLTEKQNGMLTTWALVLGASVLLAGVLAAGWILRRRRKPSPVERDTAR